VKTRSVIFLLLVMMFSLAGCDGSIDEDTMGTVVAATLEAMGVDEAGEPLDSSSPDATAEVGVDPAEVPETSGPGVLQVAYISSADVWFVEDGAAPIQLTTSGNVEREPWISASCALSTRWQVRNGCSSLNQTSTRSTRWMEPSITYPISSTSFLTHIQSW